MNARWKTTKKMPDGIDATTENGSVKAVEFTIGGQRVRINGTYGLDVLVEAEPPTEKKYRVAGTVLGLPVSEDFSEKYEADERARALASGVRDDVSLAVSEVEIPF